MAYAGTHTRAVERAHRSDRTEELLTLIDSSPDQEVEASLFDRLVELNMPVAASVAARYRGRGIPADDLEQVAYLALVRVAHTYDHTRGHDFLSYAVPSIRGEVRRYFRDQGWMVRPPRSLQETQGRIAAVESELGSEHGRPPTVEELAERLGTTTAAVLEAQAAHGCFSPTSLDQTIDPNGPTMAEGLGADDDAVDAVDARLVLAPVVRRLSDRERRILELRFFRQQTQQEIAEDIGVTQMQVSRLLAALLKNLRTQLEPGDAVAKAC